MTRVRPAAAAARLILAALLALALAGCGASVLPTVHSEPERLATARRLMDKRDYANAIELLKTYIANNGGGAQVDEAIYLLGDCYKSDRDWALAQNEFERLTRDFPESDSAGAAAFRLGEALWGQARGPDFDQEYTQKALEQWQAYLRDYPGHWLNAAGESRVQQARTRLARKAVDTGHLYLKLKQVPAARTYFETVVRDYGDSPLVGDALLGLAECDARQGHREEALATLRDLEQRFAGRPLAAEAARARQRIEKTQKGK